MNSSGSNEISIFFDTNILEGRITGHKDKFSNLYLSEIKTKNEFINVKKFVSDIGRTEEIHFCIPEISLRECKEHLITDYKKYAKQLYSEIECHKKSFGSILEIECNLTKPNVKEHVDVIYDEFIDLHNCKIINYPRNIDFFENLVNRAIQKIPPFYHAGNQNKKYTDAGFKDALIVETIIQYHKATTNICLILTDDNDFKDVFDSYLNIKVCDEKRIKEIIREHFKVKDENLIKQKIENDPYLKESLLREIGNIYDEESVLNFEIKIITQDKEDLSVYNLDIVCAVNEVRYKIICNYDSNGNAFLNVTYETSNE